MIQVVWPIFHPTLVYGVLQTCSEAQSNFTTPVAATLESREPSNIVKWKVIALLSLSLLLLGIASAWVYFEGGLRNLALRAGIGAPAVVTQVQQLKQLTTVRYTLQRVVGLNEPREPLGEESILLMVEGQALAGVDLSCLRRNDLSFQGSSRIRINLPRAKLISVYLDEKQTKVWDRRVTWWTPWVAYDPELETKARLEALDDVKGAALKMGILDEAQRNAEAAIHDFFQTLHLEATFTTSSAT